MAENDQGGVAVQSTEAPASTPTTWEQARAGATKDLTASEGGEQAAVQPGQQTPAPEPTFDIDGKKYTASDIKRFRDGHLMQADYQRKTQAVAQMRKQLEEERGQFSQAVQRFQALVQERVQQQQKPQQEEEETDPYLVEMKKRLTPFEERLQRAEAALKAQENWVYEAEVRSQQVILDRQLREMQQKYPYMQPQVVLAWIQHDQNLDIETAARASHEFAEQQLQSYLTRLQQQPTQQPNNQPAPNHPVQIGGQPPGPPLRTPKTFEEAHSGALAYLQEMERVGR